MTYKRSGILGKIISVLLLAAFLNFSLISTYALSAEKKKLPQPDYDNQVAALKDAFIGLYWDLWAQHNLTTRLRGYVAQAVDDYSGWFTAFANEKDYATAQEKTNNLFSSDFNAFLDDLQEQFGRFYSGYVLTYYRDLLEAALDKIDDPMHKEKLKETSDMLLYETGTALKGEFSEKAKGNNSVIRGGVATIGTAVLAKWAAAHLASAVATQSGITALTGALGAKIAGGISAISGILTVPVLVFGAVKLENGAENMRNGLYDPMLRNYLHAVPDVFWQQYESSIRSSFKGIYADAMFSVTDAEEGFEMDNELQELIQKYSQKKK